MPQPNGFRSHVMLCESRPHDVSLWFPYVSAAAAVVVVVVVVVVGVGVGIGVGDWGLKFAVLVFAFSKLKNCSLRFEVLRFKV